MSKMRETLQLGAEFWNDSCDLEHLHEAVNYGAVGATCNPVIVYQAISRQQDYWGIIARNFLREHADASDQDIAWMLVKFAGKKAAEILLPIYEKSDGKQGRISLQVNPYLYKSTSEMVKQGKELADLAPNISVKVPATETGIHAMEELSSLGISVNATVSFSVSQALASAEAIDRGIRKSGRKTNSYVTVMVGRVEDYIRNEITRQELSLNPVTPLWSGIAVFKEAYKEFQKQGFETVKLLSAAYRHQMHWTELVGDGVVLSIPYLWWKSFDLSKVELRRKLQNPISDEIMDELERVTAFKDLMSLNFRDFNKLVPTKNTLMQFLNGQDDLVKWVRGLSL